MILLVLVAIKTAGDVPTDESRLAALELVNRKHMQN